MTDSAAICLDPAAGELDEFWSQRVVGRANGNLFKVAKGIGSADWPAVTSNASAGKPAWSYGGGAPPDAA